MIEKRGPYSEKQKWTKMFLKSKGEKSLLFASEGKKNIIINVES